jgi:hypothetical protein
MPETGAQSTYSMEYGIIQCSTSPPPPVTFCSGRAQKHTYSSDSSNKLTVGGVVNVKKVGRALFSSFLSFKAVAVGVVIETCIKYLGGRT